MEDQSTSEAASSKDASSSKAAAKALRKQKAKEMKQSRRMKREGKASEDSGNKNCDMCNKSTDLLIRCQHDATTKWYMVCGSCWKTVSGGVVDGDSAHPNYRYGGLWKNRAVKKKS